MDKKEVRNHVFIVNPDEEPSDQFFITTKIMVDLDADNDIITEQELSLEGINASAKLSLLGKAQLTPSKLRSLASQIEREIIQARKEYKKKHGRG